jgi:hypothetical protein
VPWVVLLRGREVVRLIMVVVVLVVIMVVVLRVRMMRSPRVREGARLRECRRAKSPRWG